MSKNIEGKVVVSTGASSGLGKASARLLAQPLAATGRKTVVYSQRRPLWHRQIFALPCRAPTKSRSP